jgi:hypothetical protein
MTAAFIAAILSLAAIIWFGAHRVACRVHPGTSGTRLSLVIALFLAVWLVAASSLAMSGFFAPPPNGLGVPTFAYSLAPIVIGILAPLWWSAYRNVRDAAPLPWLIGVQLYRTFGAVFLVQNFIGTMPAVFAWPAGIGDLLIGVTALPVARLCQTGHPAARRVAIIWNILGICDLVMATTLGFLTTPGPFQALAFDSPSLTRTMFPGVLVPTFGVPLGFLLHIYALQGLFDQRRGIGSDFGIASGARDSAEEYGIR